MFVSNRRDVEGKVKSGFDYTDIVKCDGNFLLYSTKCLLFFLLKISTRYLQFNIAKKI